MFTYFAKAFKRTKAVPIDAHFVIADIAGVDRYIPISLRYEGMVFYTLAEKAYYHIDQALQPVMFSRGGGGSGDGGVIVWNVRDANNYLNYTELYYTLKAYPAGSIVRVEPLGVNFLVEASSDGNTVRIDPNTKEIRFELYDIGGSKGVEIESFLIWSELPENADLYADNIMDGGTTTPNEEVFRITDGVIHDYIPEITEVSTYYQGRFYKNGDVLYLCNGTSHGRESLITIAGSGGGGGGGGTTNYILWPQTSLIISDSVTTPYVHLKDDTKNNITTGTIGRIISELYGIVHESTQTATIVEMNFINKVPENSNSSVIVQSRYNTVMDLIGIYYG